MEFSRAQLYSCIGGQRLLRANFRIFPYFPWVVSLDIWCLGATFGGGVGGAFRVVENAIPVFRVFAGCVSAWRVSVAPARGLPLKRGAPVAGAGASGAPRPGGKTGGRSEGAPWAFPRAGLAATPTLPRATDQFHPETGGASVICLTE